MELIKHQPIDREKTHDARDQPLTLHANKLGKSGLFIDTGVPFNSRFWFFVVNN